jgi:hypothetical protein
MKRRRRRRELRIGDWPFGPPGVACRTCLREPCTCPPKFFPLWPLPDPLVGLAVELFLPELVPRDQRRSR